MPAITLAAVLMLALVASSSLPQPAEALTAALYTDSACSINYASLAHLDSNKCFPLGSASSQGFGGKIVCDAAGQVTLVGLYDDASTCNIIDFTGSGVGDGRACIALTSRANVRWSTIIDCSAAGSSAASSSASPNIPLMLGAIVGAAAVMGVAAP